MVDQTDTPLKTPFFEQHKACGAKMVAFAGYSMPIQYPMGIIKEHEHTRSHAGLFDVSHMGQVKVKGDGATAGLEKLIPVDLEALEPNQQVYGVFTSPEGGILDDLIITKLNPDEYFIVINAACKSQDLEHLQTYLEGCTIEVLDSRALLALQGPKAAQVMAKIAPEATQMVFMHGCEATIQGASCYVTRSGYTGEDGFEISLPASHADEIAKVLLSFDEVEWVGLGARDTLRLEAGLCLYGHDMNAEISPVEATLMWSIGKSRRANGTKAGQFLGAQVIFSKQAEGAKEKRVGFIVDGRVPVREGAMIENEANEVVGRMTSGGYCPTVGAPLAMGYVQTEFAALETQLYGIVRNKRIPLKVAKMPFVPQRYYRGA